MTMMPVTRAQVMAAFLIVLTGWQSGLTLERVFTLGKGEGVYAYARISPDGHELAYASELPDPARPGKFLQIIKVVDLGSKRVVFSEAGMDAYWSPSGSKMIYRSLSGPTPNVTIRARESGQLIRDVAPDELGDYYSWAFRNGQDLIVTIRSRFYPLVNNRSVLPAQSVPSCDRIGVGSRPMVSKDGRRITTFIQGRVVVRGLADCDSIFDTGITGAKADFSFDGRYIAFHAPKDGGNGYAVNIVDLQRRTRRVLDTKGSALFPSWTRDGRLCFRYDGDDYHGFVIARNVLRLEEQSLPANSPSSPPTTWSELFPGSEPPGQQTRLVFVWSPWSAHVPAAMNDLRDARQSLASEGIDLAAITAVDPSASAEDVARLLSRTDAKLPSLPLAVSRLRRTAAVNQIPTNLLFIGNALVEQRLGAMTTAEIVAWARSAENERRRSYPSARIRFGSK